MASEHSRAGVRRARRARAELRLGAGPLPDVVAAAEQRAGAHVAVLQLRGPIAGACLDRPGLRLIVVNAADAVPRQRFTVAHELGHLLLGHGSVADRPGAFSGYEHDPVEVSANAFAAEFLMPREAVQAFRREYVAGELELDDLVLMAAAFGVSAQAARYACETARVERDDRRLAELDAAIAAGEHLAAHRELRLNGLDDELTRAAAAGAPRLPPALAGSALGDLLAGRTGVAGLAASLGRPAEDVVELVEQTGLGGPVAV